MRKANRIGWAAAGVLVAIAVGCSSSGSDPSEHSYPASGAPSFGGDPSGGGEGGSPQACTATATDPKTGLVKCQEGYAHRPAARSCGVVTREADGGAGGAGGDTIARLPRAKGYEPCAEEDAGGAGGAGGTRAMGCERFEHGYCVTHDAGGAFSTCRSGCETDDECGDGFSCICDDPSSPTGGKCQPSNCRTDADCGAGSLCASYDSNFCADAGFACLGANDECRSSDDCAEGACVWQADKNRRACTGFCAN